MVKIIHCSICKRRFHINEKQKNHSSKKGHCKQCHYLGLRKNKDPKLYKRTTGNLKWQDKPLEKYSVKITKDNLDLYCKLSKIIRGKSCTNPKLVLARQQYEYIP